MEMHVVPCIRVLQPYRFGLFIAQVPFFSQSSSIEGAFIAASNDELGIVRLEAATFFDGTAHIHLP